MLVIFPLWAYLINVSIISTLKLCARWIVFTEPLVRVHQFHKMTTGPLRGCVLCVSQDGTIAVVVVDGFQL